MINMETSTRKAPFIRRLLIVFFLGLPCLNWASAVRVNQIKSSFLDYDDNTISFHAVMKEQKLSKLQIYTHDKVITIPDAIIKETPYPLNHGFNLSRFESNSVAPSNSLLKLQKSGGYLCEIMGYLSPEKCMADGVVVVYIRFDANWQITECLKKKVFRKPLINSVRVRVLERYVDGELVIDKNSPKYKIGTEYSTTTNGFFDESEWGEMPNHSVFFDMACSPLPVNKRVITFQVETNPNEKHLVLTWDAQTKHSKVELSGKNGPSQLPASLVVHAESSVEFVRPTSASYDYGILINHLFLMPEASHMNRVVLSNTLGGQLLQFDGDDELVAVESHEYQPVGLQNSRKRTVRLIYNGHADEKANVLELHHMFTY